jgi:adenylosuccinate synthase
MSDLWNGVSIESRLSEICGKYAAFRTGKPIEDAGKMIQAFMHGCEQFANAIEPLGIDQCKEPVFEGAQGLLLDQDNKAFFPHVTRSHTGMRNVRILCQQAGIDTIDAYYVSRTYLTRHGAGPLPGEIASMRYDDDTNLPHAYQGTLRFAPLDFDALLERCSADAEGDFHLVLTHCDQRAPTPQQKAAADLFAHGPTRHDVK